MTSRRQAGSKRVGSPRGRATRLARCDLRRCIAKHVETAKVPRHRLSRQTFAQFRFDPVADSVRLIQQFYRIDRAAFFRHEERKDIDEQSDHHPVEHLGDLEGCS